MDTTKQCINIPTFENIKKLEKHIKKLEKFGMNRINLNHEDGGGSEGIWAVPVDADQLKRWKDDSSNNEILYVRVINVPLGWCGVPWGGLVAARTRYSSRPMASKKDQTPEIREHNKKLFMMIQTEMAVVPELERPQA